VFPLDMIEMFHSTGLVFFCYWLSLPQYFPFPWMWYNYAFVQGCMERGLNIEEGVEGMRVQLQQWVNISTQFKGMTICMHV